MVVRSEAELSSGLDRMAQQARRINATSQAVKDAKAQPESVIAPRQITISLGSQPRLSGDNPTNR